MAADSSKVSWIAATEDALALAKNVTEAQRQIDDLEDVQKHLTRLVGEFSTLSVGASFVRPIGWEGRAPSLELARDFVEAAKTLDSRPLHRVITALERFRGEARSALIARWATHAYEEIGGVRELLELAETLTAVDGVAELSERLQTTLGELARIENDVPTARAADLLEQARENLRELEESLQPDSVRSFLTAVARGGAPIPLLSKEVTEWLESHDALNSFRIVAGSPPSETDG